MANPEHEEVLDYLDKLSVCLYRIGISLFALSLLVFAVMLSGMVTKPLDYQQFILLLMGVSGALSASNIHVYNKLIRTIISWSAWIGLVLMISDVEQTRSWLSVGFIFVTFSGIALKESFCFKVVGLKLVPALLALTTFSLYFEVLFLASMLMTISSFIIGYLSFAKWRMPLHFDIGNKASYEI